MAVAEFIIIQGSATMWQLFVKNTQCIFRGACPLGGAGHGEVPCNESTTTRVAAIY